jgi:hypothetical protein
VSFAAATGTFTDMGFTLEDFRGKIEIASLVEIKALTLIDPDQPKGF